MAEKSICWAKVTVKGKQTHASRPDSGKNAMRAGAAIIVKLDEVRHEKFADTDPVFEPSISTFEPTKKEANVVSVNIIPGEDIFYFDCRILPNYRVDEVLEFIKEEAGKVAVEHGVEVNVEAAMKQQSAPSTPVDAEVVKRLGASIKAVYDKEPSPIGIGGGTVAALLREEGFEAAVWGKMDETAHQPNEYCIIDNLIGDAKVFAHLFGQE